MARIDFFNCPRMRYTPPCEFNDPFDYALHFDSVGSDEQIHECILRNFKAIARNAAEARGRSLKERRFLFEMYSSEPGMSCLIKEVKNLISNGGIDLRKFSEDFRNNVGGWMVGVLCLTEKKDNILMWSHYASSHEGFLVGIRTDVPMFKEGLHKKYDYDVLYRVGYRADRPKSSMLEFNMASLFTKSLCWKYEKEWRVAKSLKNVMGGDGDVVGVYRIDLECISEVVVGARASVETKDAVVKFCKGNGVPVRRSRVHEKEFKLVIDSF
ncbi:MAG TPA: DUF2971 domain-containing protein [Nitratidesulfovibrio sp.]|nr:DUF2971 domain-containing protein [Nitratidesulfovibrio sp.]